MIRLSRLADYAVALAGVMATQPQKLHNALDLAQGTGLPGPTVSKILALLNRGGVLVSVRGAKGGYRLAHAPSDITITQIIAAVDGPIALTQCLEHDGACDVSRLCLSRPGWQRINDAIKHALDGVTLAEMALAPAPLPVAPLSSESRHEQSA